MRMMNLNDGKNQAKFRLITNRDYAPNQVWINDEDRVALTVIFRSETGDDFSANEKPILDALAAQDDGRRTVVYVGTCLVKAVRFPILIDYVTVNQFWSRFKHIEPKEGTAFPGSRYWWADEHLYPAVRRRRRAENELHETM